jgi:alpha-amylase/alpha-mannosidase (GH57 family)
VAFFRDGGLSDTIGFNYSDWHADDAVANLLHHLENIAEQCGEDQDCIVSIIMDGENAWEFYPQNGYYFLSTLYKQLSEHPQLELTTYSAYLDTNPEVSKLSHIVAGSWVYGTFSTWIGDADKNRGWEMLCDAKAAFDRAVDSGMTDEQRMAAEHQLAICEGSDWFWWFGDYNPMDTVSDFDELFRLHLSRLYLLMDIEPPEYLGHAFSHGGGTPLHGGTMRRGQQAE